MQGKGGVRFTLGAKLFVVSIFLAFAVLISILGCEIYGKCY